MSYAVYIYEHDLLDCFYSRLQSNLDRLFFFFSERADDIYEPNCAAVYPTGDAHSGPQVPYFVPSPERIPESDISLLGRR